MIQVDSLLAVFMAEGLVGGMLLIIGAAIFLVRRRSKERNAAIQCITHINETRPGRLQRLGDHIGESCDLEQNEIETVLTAVNGCENSFYQKLISIYLNRDGALLNSMDQNVQALTEPFFSLLSKVSEKTKEDPELAAAMETAQLEIDRLNEECKGLSNQLSMSMETTDEISAEYTRIFGSTSEAEELDMSRKRMLNTFLRAEEKMAKIFSEHQKHEVVEEIPL